jgi:nucleoside-diphosphate-sugar epimerase
MTGTAGFRAVLGTGPLGLAVARRLVDERHPVRALNRTGQAPLPPQVEVVATDASDATRLAAALAGADVVYHCASTPYASWPKTLPPIMAATIEAAAAAEAAIVYGDNLYAYGPVSGPMTESLPYRPQGRNPSTRAALATELVEAHESGAVRATIGRASDFFGPHVLLSQAGERVFGAALAGKAASVIGNPEMPHTYTFIDDFAAGLVTLGRNETAFGQVWHVPCAPTVATRRFVELVFSELASEPRLRVMPRALLTLLAVVNPTLRAVREVSYQLERPFVMDHSKFARAFGDNPTPHREAIREALAWYRIRQLKPGGSPA